MSRDINSDILNSFDDGTAFIFTGDSCFGNPGPCGAGACVFSLRVSESILPKQPKNSSGSVLLGELVGIIMIFNTFSCINNRKPSESQKVHIFSDSQSVF